MDLRRDLFPPFLALALSAGLHGGLAWWNPRPAEDPTDAELLPVVVEYLPAAGEGGTAAERAAAPAPETESAAEQPRDPSRPAEPAPAAAPVPVPAPEAPNEPPPVPREPAREAPPAPAPAQLEASAAPEEPPPLEPAVATPRPVPLADLLPQAADLKPYRAPATVPDPAGGEAREATLILGDVDVRYRGYLDAVQSAIDRSWRWKEALLAAGGGGRVLVRFTLGPDGSVEEVGVAESSGSPLLDREAAEAVRRAPLPPFPSHWTLERLTLFAQFAYRLE